MNFTNQLNRIMTIIIGIIMIFSLFSGILFL